MARTGSRTQGCDRSDALTRLAQAESFLLAAELIVEDDSDAATPSVAASLAVLAGIAASDAACCATRRARRGQSHAEAIELLGTVAPGGADMAKDLQRLLNRKDDSQYGLAFVAAAEATRMVGSAKRLLGRAQKAVQA